MISCDAALAGRIAKLALAISFGVLAGGCAAALGITDVIPVQDETGESDTGAADANSTPTTGASDASTPRDDGGISGNEAAAPAPSMDGAENEAAVPGPAIDGGVGVDSGLPLEASTESGSSATYPAVVLGDMPLAYWRLGEQTGSVAHDETGHGNDANYPSTCVLGVPGAIAGDPGTAVQFDGADCVLNAGTAFDFPGQVPFTLEGWVNPSVVDGMYRTMASTLTEPNGVPDEGTYVFIGGSPALVGFERWTAGNCVVAVNSPSVPVQGSWSHVVATYDGNLASLYVNGALVGTIDGSGGVPQSSVPLLWGSAFQGRLDEIAVYDHALPSARVTAHWQAAQ